MATFQSLFDFIYINRQTTISD